MTRHSVGDDLTETRDALRPLTPAESLLGMARAVQQFSCNIVKLIEKSDACDARLNQVEATERTLAELLLHLARQRVLNHTPVAAAAASELNAVPHDISDTRQTEKQIQGSLQTIDGALAHISNRLSAIEAKISREVGSPPDFQPPPALGVDRLTPAAPVPTELPIEPEQSATPATHEPDSNAPTLLGCAVDPNPSPNDALDSGPDAARGHKPIASADHLPACESAGDARSGLKVSVMPDRGGRSELIAAARRAAQAASGDIADEASAVAKIAAGAPARGRRDPGQRFGSNETDHTDRHCHEPRYRAHCRSRTGRHRRAHCPATTVSNPDPTRDFLCRGRNHARAFEQLPRSRMDHRASARTLRSGIGRRCEQRRRCYRWFDLSIGHGRAIRGQSQA
jgi:hypothetical protein